MKGIPVLPAALLALALHGCQAPAPPVTLEVINWNTYHLFDHKAKIEQATAWLAEQAPDLVALQEVLHIKEAGLEELARSWGHDHAVMHKESGYPVALTSSQPIEVVARVTKGHHHGYLHARTHGLDVFVIHFWPTQLHEAEAVSKQASALVQAGRPVVVMGDFNGKIRFDEAYLLEHGFGERKNGTVDMNYGLTDAFLDKGFVELVSLHSPEDLYTFGAPALIPRWAKTLEDVESRRRRIDFIFTSPDLAAASKSAQVNTDDSTVGLYSDHYPVLCTFEAPALKSGLGLQMVRPRGFEPLAYSSGGCRSIQLSYGRTQMGATE